MPNRIIKESICRSDTVNELSWFEEILFYRLIVNCDDFGRFDARPAIIKGSVFPLKSVTEKQILDALSKLSTVGIVYLYDVDGKPYLQFVTWEHHQRIRNSKEKYPAPSDEFIAIAETCGELRRVVARAGAESNPIQSESNPNPNPNPNSVCTDLFERFYRAYPKHVAKADAEKAFKKLKADDALVERMVTAIEAQKKSKQWLKDDGQFIPHPATWLNRHEWENEQDKPIKPKRATSFDLGEYGSMVNDFVPVYGNRTEVDDA